MSAPEAGLTIRELLLEIRDDQAKLSREIRDTKHQVRSDIRAVEMRIVELEQFRREATHRMDGLDAVATKYVPMIEQLTAQEKITQAVEVALEQSEHRGWTKRERLLAIGLFILTTIGVGVSVASFVVLRLAE